MLLTERAVHRLEGAHAHVVHPTAGARAPAFRILGVDVEPRVEHVEIETRERVVDVLERALNRGACDKREGVLGIRRVGGVHGRANWAARAERPTAAAARDGDEVLAAVPERHRRRGRAHGGKGCAAPGWACASGQRGAAPGLASRVRVVGVRQAGKGRGWEGSQMRRRG